MRVLLTGAAGYIGSITTRTLLDRGHECIVLDNLVHGWRESVDARAQFIEGSVGDSEVVARALDGCDAVVHMAGLIEVAESQKNPDLYFRVNSLEPLVLLDAMRAADVKALVFSSTAAVYGEPTRVPIAETARTEPVNAYGASKLAFERSVTDCESWGLRAVRFRYFNVAGAWPDGSVGEAHAPETHLIPRILTAIRDGAERVEVFGGDYATKDGTCVRDYIHVCDLAAAHALGIERLGAGEDGGVFNLGNGSGFSNLEVVRACMRAAGREIEVMIGPRREGDPAKLVASAARAKSVLGWVPERAELDGIVADAWRWHLAHPNGYR
ncbi:MAG: UDP-glucose 4-epimerase GalE [Coriobacteriia bacterium]|nr:UDP-glucose 4-epimerase GalE [Coriobacteriia bacterium]